VLLFCWATWCPTCGVVAPVVDQLAVQWKGKIRVAKLNVDPNPMLAAKFDLRSVPTFLVFDNGQLKDTLVGGLPKQEIERRMAPYL
jgi:thioredoxin 2